MFRTLALALVLACAGQAVADDAQRPSMPPVVNINTAEATELADALVGVGLSRAQAIVAYRKSNGAFRDVADLARVKGIGMRTVARNADRIVLDE